MKHGPMAEGRKHWRQGAGKPHSHWFCPTQHCTCVDDCSSSNCLCGQLSIRCWYDKVRVPHLAKYGRSHRRSLDPGPCSVGEETQGVAGSSETCQERCGPLLQECEWTLTTACLPAHFLVSDLSLQTLCALPPLPWAGVRVEFPVESSGSRAAETGPTEKPLSPSLRTPGRAAASGV